MATSNGSSSLWRGRLLHSFSLAAASRVRVVDVNKSGTDRSLGSLLSIEHLDPAVPEAPRLPLEL